MKPKMVSALILTAAMLLTGCDGQRVQPVKFMHPEKVMQDSGLAEQVKIRLQAVDKRLRQGLKMAQENGARLPAEERDGALLADQQLLNREWQHAQRQANSIAMKALAEAAEKYRQQHQLLAILSTQSALAAAPEADISEALAEMLKKTTLEFGALPQIGVKTAAPAASKPRDAT